MESYAHESELRELEIEVNEFVAWCKNIRNRFISENGSEKEPSEIDAVKLSEFNESCQNNSSNNNHSQNTSKTPIARSITQEGGEHDLS